jgi:hypothetical protein
MSASVSTSMTMKAKVNATTKAHNRTTQRRSAIKCNAMAMFVSSSRVGRSCGSFTSTTDHGLRAMMIKKSTSNNNNNKTTTEQQRRNATITKANADGDDSSEEPSAADAPSDDPFEFGSKSKKRRRRDGKSTRRAKVAVDSPAIAAAKGEAERTVIEESEESFLKFLGVYITIIFAFGIILALSAFKIWPDSVDAFITDTLYPAFTPFVGGFLVFSSIYGLIKTRSDPDSKSG